jgi:5-formyltetrahydrofolate cyclo-ligase
LNKAALRLYYLEKRKSLTTRDVEGLSQRIFLQLKRLNIFNDICNLHIFYPISTKKEINTIHIANWIRKEYPDINLILPKSDLQSHTLKHIIWNEGTPLAVNKWGITEPEQGEEITPSEIDLVLMPLLAFDENGNRVGYGKGFYDRFLTECRGDTLKVGLSHFEPEVAFEQVDPFDIPMDYCVTPTKLWPFNK